MFIVVDVMIDAVMTLIFTYSIYKIKNDYPGITVALTIYYLSALMTLLYNRYSIDPIINF